MKPSAVKDVVLGLSLAALFVLAQRGKKLPEQRISVVVTLAQRGNSSRSTDKLLLNRRTSHCTTWSTEDHGTPHSAHSRSAVMPHGEQMTLQR